MLDRPEHLVQLIQERLDHCFGDRSYHILALWKQT